MPPLEFRDAATTRRLREERQAAITLGNDAEHGVKRTEIFIDAHGDDAPPVRCLLYEPIAASDAPRAGYLHLHGGSYLVGSPEAADSQQNLVLAGSLSIVVLAVAYRLSPEHSGPAALHDAYAGLSFLHRNAERLVIDVSRIGVGGDLLYGAHVPHARRSHHRKRGGRR